MVRRSCSTRHYIILAVNRDDPRKIWGWCDWGYWNSRHVCIWNATTPKEDASSSSSALRSRLDLWNYMKRYVDKAPAGYDVKVFRVGSKNCPVEVDMRLLASSAKIQNELRHTSPSDFKFRRNNPPFIVNALKDDKNKTWKDYVPDFKTWVTHRIKDAVFYEGKLETVCHDRTEEQKHMDRRRRKILKNQKKRSVMKHGIL